MMKDALLRYNHMVPRYTSYPTAPHFQPMDGEAYAESLSRLTEGEDVSLYVHVPFCAEMCWYCGCHTTATRKYAPVESYVALLLREMKLAEERAGGRLRVSHVHFGGGSPTMLRPDDFRLIMETARACFDISADAEIAIEADPRGVSADKAEAYRDCGVNRASFGIQDFSPEVQHAINRVQSFSTVEKAVSLFRHFGIDRINFDLMYGLPRQNLSHIWDTAAKSLSLAPQRIALFGYAHVPWMKKHMRLIKDEDLPDAAARIDQFALAEKLLTGAGMAAVGLDHFAGPHDDMLRALREKRLARNFQGYTTDGAKTLIGFGVSAIGRAREGFFQNAAHMPEYSAAILGGKLPVCRGRFVDDEDRLRSEVISGLMCYLEADVRGILRKHRREASHFDPVLQSLKDMAEDGLVTVEAGTVRVNPAARQAVRVVAARFDAYFKAQEKKHTQAA